VDEIWKGREAVLGVCFVVADSRKGDTCPAMKLTINVDDELMRRVKELTCAESEEEAITRSLMSMSTRLWAKEYWSVGTHPTREELGNAYAPDYDPRVVA